MWRKYDNLFERGKMSSKQLLSAVLARLPGLLGPDRDLKFYRHGWCGGGGGGGGQGWQTEKSAETTWLLCAGSQSETDSGAIRTSLPLC